jgi:iron-sulfur cluster repair protein YtfE (RIC family)
MQESGAPSIIIAAIISAAGVFVAGVIGQAVGAVFGTRAAAKINAATALDIEQIKAQTARELEREKEYRQWKRERVAAMIDHLINMKYSGARCALCHQRGLESTRGHLKDAGSSKKP